MIEEQFLRDLQRDMNELAHDTLKRNMDPAEMARAAGRYQGMKHACDLLQKIVRGTEEQD